MPLQDFLDRLTLTRRLVKALERQASATEAQNLLLARLADHFAPELPPISEADRVTSGPSFARNAQLARLEEWTEGFLGRMGRPPTETEVEDWLHEDDERGT